MNADDRSQIVQLAHEAPFALGAMHVSPATREVLIGDRRDIVEPRIMEVLVALARRQGEVVSRDDLIVACWGGRAVGEDAINRCIAGVRRLGEAAGGISVTTVPRVGYRLEADAPPAEAQPAAGGPDQVVLAVLAFDNLSGDADTAYFSDGVSEEILHAVTRGPGLRVIGRGSSFQFRGADKAAGRVAAALKATHVLDGSVRRNGDRLRISASLIECAGETTIWSDRFDRELSDVFALQDEIAGAVATALEVAFAPSAPAEVIDPAAYNLYLRALEVRNRDLEAETRRLAIGWLQEATGLSPNFARAWEALAIVRAERLRYDPGQSRAEACAEIVAAATTALRLDPASGAAYQALAQLEAQGHFAEREALHNKALAVAPNDPIVLLKVALFLSEVGRIGDALEHMKHAYRLDPMSPLVANWYGNLLDFSGRFEEGTAFWKKVCLLWPDNELIVFNALYFAANKAEWGRFDELAAAARARGLSTTQLLNALAYGDSMRDRSKAALAGALPQARDTMARTGAPPLLDFSRLYRLGLTDEVFELVDQATFAHMFDPDLPSPDGILNAGNIFNVAYNEAMMRDVRFVRLCAKRGLVAYWVETGRWPDCADAVAPWYDFRAEARRLAAA